eukprot:g16344.t1
MSWRGRHVETPHGWGICVAESDEFLEVALDRAEASAQRSRCSVRHEEVQRSSFCALGTCIETSFGPGVVLRYRPTDDVHEVQLWCALSHGKNRAFLPRQALKQVLSALPGLAVLTPKGQGLCQTVNAEQISVVLDGGEVVRLDAGDVQCPVAKTWPLAAWRMDVGATSMTPSLLQVSRFLDAAAALLRLHSGTLARLAEAFRNLGLEQLQEQTLSKASQAAGDALKLWDEWEAKEAQEVAQVLKSHADEAMPKLRACGYNAQLQVLSWLLVLVPLTGILWHLASSSSHILFIFNLRHSCVLGACRVAYHLMIMTLAPWPAREEALQHENDPSYLNLGMSLLEFLEPEHIIVVDNGNSSSPHGLR